MITIVFCKPENVHIETKGNNTKHRGSEQGFQKYQAKRKGKRETVPAAKQTPKNPRNQLHEPEYSSQFLPKTK